MLQGAPTSFMNKKMREDCIYQRLQDVNFLVQRTQNTTLELSAYSAGLNRMENLRRFMAPNIYKHKSQNHIFHTVTELRLSIKEI